MKILKITFATLLGLGLLAAGSWWYFYGPQADYGRKVLVFSKTQGYRHESIEPGIDAIEQLGRAHKFNVEASEDPSLFNQQDLSNYQVVLFLNTTGDVLNGIQQESLERFIQAGGGFVGVHAAADTEWDGNQWPWYTRLVGAAFKSHPNSPSNVQQATVLVTDDSHGSTAHLNQKWVRNDEWYDYQRFYPAVNVLLTVDESTYEGATSGAYHPIAWYHDFDGGRSFYTGLGHTPESYQEQAFLQHLAGGISYALGDGEALDYAKAKPESWRFRKKILDSSLAEPMAMAFREDGALYFVERKGALKLHNFDSGESAVVATFPVYSNGENGLQGITFRKDSQGVEWIYLFHTLESAMGVAHSVARYPMRGKSPALDAGETLIEIPIDAGELQHVGGSLQFDARGDLWISVGDNTNPHESKGYSPTDYREDRRIFDAGRGAGNSQDLRGKILRIRPDEKGGYAIPEGNLFKDPARGRPEIYAMGVRNPFRFSVDMHSGTLYWGEVGPDAQADQPGRGPRGYDEFNRTDRAGFFGWPYVIGNNFPYAKYDYATGLSPALHDPAAVINNSPRNTGIAQLPAAIPAWIYYPYVTSDEFLELGEGGRSAMAGPVFYYDDYPDNPVKLPPYYDGKLLVYDWMRRWIKAISMDAQGAITKIEGFMEGAYFSAPIDMKLAPDGSLYLLEYGSAWFSQNDDAYLTRIEYYASDNPPPQAVITSTNTVGTVPLQVTLSATQSLDPNGVLAELSFVWARMDKGKVVEELGRDMELVFTTVQPGEHEIQLTVTDRDGAESSAGLIVEAGNDTPQISVEFPQGNSSFYWADVASVNYAIVVTDTEDGSTEHGSIDPGRVAVSFEFLPEGEDLAGVAMGHKKTQGDGNAGGKELMESSDCLACHQADKQSVGPSFNAIAQRYASDDGAAMVLVDKVLSGGAGIWGELAMPPHPQLSKEAATAMVAYILDPDAVTQGLALNGHLSFDRHEDYFIHAEDINVTFNPGRYVLNVSYRDKGAPGANFQQANYRRVFRYASLTGGQFDEYKDVLVTAPPMPELKGVDLAMMNLVGEGKKPAYAKISAADLAGVRAVRFGIITTSIATVGGELEIRLGSVDGELIASKTIENTSLGLPDGPDFYELELPALTGQKDIYIVGASEKSGRGAVFILLTTEFLRQ